MAELTARTGSWRVTAPTRSTNLDDQARALGEATRVLRTGGRAVLLGQDWDAIVIESDDAALTRRTVHARADTITSPRAARGYGNALRASGFTDVTLEVRTGVFTDATVLPMLTGLAAAAHSSGAITSEQHDRWMAEQTSRGHDGALLLAVPIFIAAGRRA